MTVSSASAAGQASGREAAAPDPTFATSFGFGSVRTTAGARVAGSDDPG